MKYNLILVFILMCLNFSNAQNSIKEYPMIGFACYAQGSQSEAVRKVTDLLVEKRYDLIAKLLQSKNSAELYLAVISLERLLKLREYEISKNDINLMDKVYRSRNSVSICSGCTYFKTLRLNKLFKSEYKSFAELWLDYNIDSNLKIE